MRKEHTVTKRIDDTTCEVRTHQIPEELIFEVGGFRLMRSRPTPGASEALQRRIGIALMAILYAEIALYYALRCGLLN
jgi:hypothetical protein